MNTPYILMPMYSIKPYRHEDLLINQIRVVENVFYHLEYC